MNRQMRFLLLMLLLLSQAASLAAEVKVGPVDTTLEPLLSSQWVCYVKDGDLYLWSTGKDPLRMREGKDKGVTIMSPSLRAAGPSIFMAWVERSPGGNKVLFTASRDNGRTFGDIAELASGIKATNVRIFADSKENLYIIDASGKEPELFLNFSSDKGKTFRRVPLQLEELSSLYHPVVVVTDDLIYLFYFAMKGEKGQVRGMMIDRVSLEQKGSVVLKEVEGVPFMEGWSAKGKPVVLYKTSREGIFALEGFVKEDASWKAFRIKEAEGLDVARMDHHEWGDGRMLVVFSGEDRSRFKQRIYAAVSEDAGMNWDVKRIDNKEFDNTRAWLPRMAVDGDKVAVVWEDSRDIRSGVRMKLSSDRGKTWRERDIPLTDTKRYAFRPRISFSNGAFYAAWDQFRDDEKKAADLVMVKLKWDEMLKMESRKAKVISPKKKEALLRARVNAYWKGMLKKDMKVTYEIHDPFYKARIPFDSYASLRGPIVYHSYSLEDVKIEGNVATAKIKVKYDVPKITIMGKETSIPPKEVVAEDTYLFIDGKWFRRFVDAISGGGAIDY